MSCRHVLLESTPTQHLAATVTERHFVHYVHAPCPVQPARAALLDPPAFDPAKLQIEYLPGGRELALAAGRRYTLTHNDVTGSLQLSIGAAQAAAACAGKLPMGLTPWVYW